MEELNFAHLIATVLCAIEQRKTKQKLYSHPELLFRVNIMKMISILLCLYLLTGCATASSGFAYTRGQAETLKMGVVESVVEVRIEGTSSLVGSTLGSLVGSIGGSFLGQGTGAAVGSVVGAVAGSVYGTYLEQRLTRVNGTEIVIKLSDGSRLSVVQERSINEVDFKVGEEVHVDETAGLTRISRQIVH